MSDLTARGAAQMSDELVNTLENLGLFFGGATGRLTRDYGELSGHNFQMMAMHTDPEKLAKDLASLAEAAARIRLLEQQLKTAREEVAAGFNAGIDAAMKVVDQYARDAERGAMTYATLAARDAATISMQAATDIAAAISSLGEKDGLAQKEKAS